MRALHVARPWITSIGLVLLASLGGAAAETCDLDSTQGFPFGVPNDPEFATCERIDGVPPAPNCMFFEEQWNLLGCRPATAPAVTQLDGVSGIGVQDAWRRTTGDPEVMVAILDSGIDWNRDSVRPRIALNLGEVPPPTDGGVPCVDSDCDGDGRLSVLDYFDLALDLDSNDTNGNGKIDAQDLLRLYADSIDDDGNGYVDDIAGWDFFEGDNDPFDDLSFGHGSGMASTVAEVGNDGSGGIGVAPDTAIVPLRVGDSFVVNIDDFALAVLYATDLGVRAVNSSLGAYNQTPFARAAVEYAHDNGTVILAAMADENSRHPNWPSTYPHTINVKAVVPITLDLFELGDALVEALEDAGEILLALLVESQLNESVSNSTVTFLQHSPCTNFGAHTHWVFPSTACASGATAGSSGLVALVTAYSRQLWEDGSYPFDLSADEVKQVVTSTADDVEFAASVGIFDQYPAQPGWDQYYGYGRPNAGRLFDALEAGEVPPEVWLSGPEWYEMIDPDTTPSIAVVGHVGAPRTARYSYTVEVAPGVEPLDGEFETILDSGERVAEFDGLLALWDVSALRGELSAPPTDPNSYAYTIRVRATDDRGLVGEDRRQIFLHQDPSLVAGFPYRLGTSGESSPKLVDLDRNGTDEIVLATSDGRVHVLRGDLLSPPGWPTEMKLAEVVDPAVPGNHLAAPAFASGAVSPDLRSATVATVAVGDVAGDALLEVVASGLDGCVYVWDALGREVDGFPVCVGSKIRPDDPVDPGFISSPVIADIDGDGSNEIIAASMNQNLYVLNGDGTAQPGFPVLVRDAAAPDTWSRIVSTPAVGELSLDSPGLEIVLGTNEVFDTEGRLHAFRADGTPMPGWPQAVAGAAAGALPPDILPIIGEGVTASPAMADVDFDGEMEVVISTIGGQYTLFDKFGLVRTMRSGGFERTPERRAHALIAEFASPIFADLTGDGLPEVMGAGMSPLAALSIVLTFRPVRQERYMGVWDSLTGEHLPGFPAVMDDWQFLSQPAVADVSGDGDADLIAASSSYLVRAFDASGEPIPGFPKHTGGWVLGVPAVGDLDGDGRLEVVAVTRNGYLYAWHTDGIAEGHPGANVQWSGFHGDVRNTGCLEPTLP